MPTTFDDTLSPPVSPLSSPPPMMITLPASSANGFCSWWQHHDYAEIASPNRRVSESSPMSWPCSPLLSLQQNHTASFRQPAGILNWHRLSPHLGMTELRSLVRPYTRLVTCARCRKCPTRSRDWELKLVEFYAMRIPSSDVSHRKTRLIKGTLAHRR